MKDQEPEFLFQGINYLGLLSKQLADLRGMPTLANELIQNADDAKDESGNFSATRITFDLRDDALVVSNNAVFREDDFRRLQDVAGGSKRSEFGDPTTGAFGVGFISVYQITDRPELRSAGRRWILRPQEDEKRRIAQYQDPSATKDKGTIFTLPWAYSDTHVRRQLKVQAVDRSSIDLFERELKQSIPRAILFLKNVTSIDLYRNQSLVSRTRCSRKNGQYKVTCNGTTRTFRIIEGEFKDEAAILRNRYPSIEKNRSCVIRLAIPDAAQSEGMFFATLPTQQSTGLPFHIDADFFPSSDRRSIALESSYDYRSEWNRAAIRAAAAIIRDNLTVVRDMFSGDPARFWALLDSIRQVHLEHKDSTRRPFGVFWEELRPSLSSSPIVYSESGRWIEPGKSRITVGMAEREATAAFHFLGIELVHDTLRRFQNVLTTGDVGVSTLKMDDIRRGLERHGLTERPQTIPRDLRDGNLLELLWIGIYGVIQNSRRQGANREREGFLRRCVIAPGLDGRLWPCDSVYQADVRTREIFAHLLSRDRSFLCVSDVPLLNEFCPRLTLSAAVTELRRLSVGRFEKARRTSSFRPATLLQWFDENKTHLTVPLREKLALVPVYPSAGALRPLKDLYIPGGFDDPLRLSGLIDMAELPGLSDFLTSLGARVLKIEEYATKYVPRVFASDSEASTSDRHKVLGVLSRHLGEISRNDELRETLGRTRLIECTDYEFRRAGQAYIHCQDVVGIFGELLPYTQHLGYVRNQVDSDSLERLYQWLGVADRPRVLDVKHLLDRLTSQPVDSDRRRFSQNILTGLGRLFDALSDSERTGYEFLKQRAWLTANDNGNQWWRPDDLYAAYSRNLFHSQARFLDISVGDQQRISNFLSYLEVNLTPEPSLVAAHLLQCTKSDLDPPRDVYRWLNERAQPRDLKILIDSPCLRVEGKWLCPREVFWGKHSFGRFRFQLGSHFRQYQKLLSALHVKEDPDCNDAIDVLQEVAGKQDTPLLSVSDKNVVLQCWIILADALRGDTIDRDSIRVSLCDVRCVPRHRPNGEETLSKPTSVFFDDGYRDRFEMIKWNLIPRTEHIWVALEAAGVRPLGDSVQAEIGEATNRRDDPELKELVKERMPLIEAVLEKSVALTSVDRSMSTLREIQFQSSDELTVQLTVEGFGRSETVTSSEDAYFDRSDGTLYLASRTGHRPWGAIARELSRAIAPGEDNLFLVPVFRMVLEAGTQLVAVAELRNCNIQIPEEMLIPESEGSVVEEFERVSEDHETAHDGSIDFPPASSSPDTRSDGSFASDDDYSMPAHSQDGDINQIEPQRHIEMERDLTPEDDLPESLIPFDELLFEVQTSSLIDVEGSPVIFPEGGAENGAICQRAYTPHQPVCPAWGIRSKANDTVGAERGGEKPCRRIQIYGSQ